MAKTAPGSFELRNGSIRWRVMIGGEMHRATFPTTDMNVAKNKAIQEAAKLQSEYEEKRARAAAGLDDVPTMAALFDEFEATIVPTRAPGTRRSYADSLKPLRAYFVDELRNPLCDKVRGRDIERFLSWRRVRRWNGAEPVSARTVAKDRAVLSAVFKMAFKLEHVPSNPVGRTDVPKGDVREPVIVSGDLYEALLRECEHNPMLHTYVILLAEAGIRSQSEALRLRWEDIDLDDGFLYVVSGRDGGRTESGKRRPVPLTARLREALREHAARYRLATYQGRRSPWVFHHVKGVRGRKAGEHIGTMRSAVKQAARRAKLPAGLHVHDLRHTCCTNLVADGHQEVLVQKFMGHADLRTTMGYTHLVKDHLRVLVEPLDADVDAGGRRGGAARRRASSR